MFLLPMSASANLTEAARQHQGSSLAAHAGTERSNGNNVLCVIARRVDLLTVPTFVFVFFWFRPRTTMTYRNVITRIIQFTLDYEVYRIGNKRSWRRVNSIPVIHLILGL